MPHRTDHTDFSGWQREWLGGGVLDEQLSYWKRRLSGRLPVLALPTDRPRPAMQSFRGAREALSLSPSLTQGLRELSRREGVTLFMTLLAAFDVLLSRYTGQEDILVLSPIAGRARGEREGLIGFFGNKLVLRTDLSGDPTFRELLGRVREVALEAYANQDLPFEKLVEELQPQRSVSHSPLFQVMFVLQNAPREARELSGLMLTAQKVNTETAKFELALTLLESGDRLEGILEYNADLFEGETAGRMLQHLQVLLTGIVAHPEERLSRLPLLSGAERHRLLVEWNRTEASYPRDTGIHQLFEAQAQRTPEAPAILFQGETLTYRQLNARANQLAHSLRKQGITLETRVGICLERSLEMFVGLLAILKAGGAYVPLDPSYPRELTAFMLEDARVTLLLTQHRLLEKTSHFGIQTLSLDSDRHTFEKEDTHNPENPTSPDQLAYIIYTSGSTGKPKGVLITHRNLVASTSARISYYPDAGPFLLLPSLAFDSSAAGVFSTLCRGALLVLPTEDSRRDPARLARQIARDKVSYLLCVPSLWAEIVREAGAVPLDGLRTAVVAGEACPRELVLAHRESLPATDLFNEYGPTEATVWSTVYECREPPPGREVPIGRPIANTRIYLLDSQLQPVPIGVPGEIFIAGEGVARGYWNRPELNAEKFLPDPFGPGRLYRTGDLARYLSDGNIEFLGRTDQQVKIRGFRIEPGEVEAVLSQHPAVRECAVIGREGPSGDKGLVAYAASEQTPPPSPEELRAFARSRLPDHMVPSAFILLKTLPRTPNGKLDRLALPAPGRSGPDLAEPFVPPRTPAERTLAEIWCDVLGLERVGAHDDFFLLGGDSLLATRVLSRLRDAFNADIPLRQIFDAPTVVGLARRVERSRRARTDRPLLPVRALPRDKELPLSFAQQRLWFLDQLGQGSSAYNLPQSVRLEGPLDAAALEKSLTEIIRRHESLRTTFPAVEGTPVQLVAPPGPGRLPLLDLQHLSEKEREEEARRLAVADARQPFDLARGPLLRASLLRLKPREHLLLLNMHHIVSDAWSSSIFMRELRALYLAFSAGKRSPLPELPFHYADFSSWQREWLGGGVLDEQLSYWKRWLSGRLPVLALPTDRPRPAMQSFRGAREALSLSPSLTQGLRELSRREGVTLFMTLLAAFDALLSRYAGQEDILVGSPIAGRTRVETEDLIGFFVNTLVLRSDLSGNPTFRELLARLREVCLEAHAHQDLPFEKLVEELQPERRVSHSPLFQVMFALENAPEEPWELSGLKATPFAVDTATAKFDLTLTLIEGPEELSGVLEYNTDLFDASTAARMLGHFRTLLEGAVADPETRLSDLPLLTPDERRQILVEWNRTDADYPRSLCVHQLFEAQAEKTPDSAAVVFEGETFSYRQLNERANRIAHHLRRRGVGPETMVAIYAERSFEMIAGLLGVLKAGGAYLPLDPSYPQVLTAFMLEDSGASLLLTQERLQPSLSHPRSETIRLDQDWIEIAPEKPGNLENLATPENLAYLIYTSGSTGKPKGAMIPHRGLVNYLAWCAGTYPLEEGEGSPVHSSIAFDLTITSLFAPLLAGRAVFLLPEEDGIKGLADALQGARDFSLVKLTPTHLDALSGLLAEQGGAARSAALVVGGESLRGENLLFWRDQSPGIRIFNEYGPTETVVGCTFYEVPDGAPAPGEVPIGRPIANTRIYILDAWRNPVPIGVPGEIFIGGDGVARGYWNRPELTAEKFLRDPFREEPEARLYRTGDLARYLPDGRIEFLGRLDQQVKVRGFRIEPGEVEAALNRHPAVRESVVLTHEDSPWDKRLAAYLTARGAAPSLEELRGFLKDRLPDHMIPSAFIFLESLPKTPGGKVDRKALPAPGQGDRKPEQTVSPRDAVERELARIWESVLGVEGIGVRDNFFERGGHSLLAVRLFSRIEKAFGRRLPLATLFQAGTIEELAKRLRQERWSGPWSSLVEIQKGGDRPPFFCVHPIGGNILAYHELAHRLGPDQPVYGLQAMGLDRRQPPFTSVEDMAEHYLREIRDVRPQGPYYLGGMSFGGVVAFEMACRLHAQGEEVALLAMFDTHCPVYPRSLPETGLHRFKLERLLQRAAYHAKNLLWGPDPRAHLLNVWKTLRNRLRRRVSRLAGRLSPASRSAPARMTVYEANKRALERYTPGIFPGQITFFRAAERSMRTSYDPRAAWEEFARDGMEVREVQGPHGAMLLEPHVTELARELRACLEREAGRRERLSSAG